MSDVETVVEHDKNILVPDSDVVKEAFKCKVYFIFLLSSNKKFPATKYI